MTISDTIERPTGLTMPAHDARPMGTSSRDRLRPARHAVALVHRGLLKTRRTPEALIDVTVQPVIFLFLFVYLFGGAIAGGTHSYLQFVLPGLLVQSVLFASVAIGVNLNSDVEKGVRPVP